jgi:hypothetical protein
MILKAQSTKNFKNISLKPENELSNLLRKLEREKLSEMEVLQMQSDMKENSQLDASTDEELIDVLIAISVVSKRLANKLRQPNMKKEENPSE